MARIKKNDTVVVIHGKDKKKTGKVISVSDDRVKVQGINIIKKAIKPKSQQDKGGIVSIEASLHVSSVMLVSKGKKSRIGITVQDGKKKRIAKKTGEVL